MTKSPLLALALLLIAAVTLPSVGGAQSAQVRNTGCPNAAYPKMTGAKIGAPVTVTFPSLPTTDIPFVILGWSSGNPLALNKPFTCVNNCRLYPAVPFFFLSPFPAGTKDFTFTVPNDPSLFQTCYSVQTAAAGAAANCVDLHGALSFCVGR